MVFVSPGTMTLARSLAATTTTMCVPPDFRQYPLSTHAKRCFFFNRFFYVPLLHFAHFNKLMVLGGSPSLAWKCLRETRYKNTPGKNPYLVIHISYRGLRIVWCTAGTRAENWMSAVRYGCGRFKRIVTRTILILERPYFRLGSVGSHSMHKQAHPTNRFACFIDSER